MELTVLSVQYDLLFIACINSDLMMGILDVQLADDQSSMLYVKHLHEQQETIIDFHCGFGKSSVIHTLLRALCSFIAVQIHPGAGNNDYCIIPLARMASQEAFIDFNWTFAWLQIQLYGKLACGFRSSMWLISIDWFGARGSAKSLMKMFP